MPGSKILNINISALECMNKILSQSDLPITSKELEITQENRGRGIEKYKTKGTPLQELKLKP